MAKVKNGKSKASGYTYDVNIPDHKCKYCGYKFNGNRCPCCGKRMKK